MATRRIEKKFTGFKDKSSIKLNTPATTFTRPSAGGFNQDPIDAPAKNVKNLTRFKKSMKI